MNVSPRCLFNSDFSSFLYKDIDSVFGTLCNNYHGDALLQESRGNQKIVPILVATNFPPCTRVKFTVSCETALYMA